MRNRRPHRPSNATQNQPAGLRIIAGEHRGRRLAVPAGKNVRPTSDRARESLFNILTNGYRRPDGTALLANARVLDGFAGSGALGLEALSRGASQVYFAEKDPAALACLRQNLAAFTAQTEILAGSIEALPQASHAADLLLLDPPYDYEPIANLLLALQQRGWLNRESLLILERDAKASKGRQDSDLAAFEQAGLEPLERRVLGRNAFHFLQVV